MTPDALPDVFASLARAVGSEGELGAAAPIRFSSRGTWVTPLAHLLAASATLAQTPQDPTHLAANLAARLRRVSGIVQVHAMASGQLEITLDPPNDAELRILRALPTELHLGGGVASFGPPAAARIDDHPAFEVLRAHARLAARQRTATAAGIVPATEPNAELLRQPTESVLIGALFAFRVTVRGMGASASARRNRRAWVNYLRELAGATHAWCDACPSRPFGDDAEIDVHPARGWLDETTRTALAHGLRVLDVDAPAHL